MTFKIMRLQKHKDRYYTIIIPKDFIKELGWNHRDDIIVVKDDSELRLINQKNIEL